MRPGRSTKHRAKAQGTAGDVVAKLWQIGHRRFKDHLRSTSFAKNADSERNHPRKGKGTNILPQVRWAQPSHTSKGVMLSKGLITNLS